MSNVNAITVEVINPVASITVEVINPVASITVEVVDETNVDVISLGIQGPEGIRGPSGGALSVTARQDLGGDRAVTVNGFYCNQSDAVSLYNYAGITKSAVISGDTIDVTKNGEHSIVGATLTPNLPIYIGESGVLTQDLSTGTVRRIGWAITSELINLDPFPIINGV